MLRTLSCIVCLALMLSVVGCAAPALPQQPQTFDGPVFMLDHLPDIGEYVDDVICSRKFPEHRDWLLPGGDYGKLVPFVGSIRQFHFVDYETGQWTEGTHPVCRYGLMNTQGQLIVDAVFDDVQITEVSDAEYLITLTAYAPGGEQVARRLMCNSDGSWVMESKGNIVINLSAWASGFVIATDYSRVNYDTQTGGPSVTFYDLSGNTRFSFQNCEVYSTKGFQDGLIILNRFTDYYLYNYETICVDTNGNQVFSGIYINEDFRQGLAPASDRYGQHGILNTQGRWAVAPVYDTIYSMDRYYIASQGQEITILDLRGQAVCTLPQSMVSNGYLDSWNGRIYVVSSQFDGANFLHSYFDVFSNQYLRCQQTGYPLTHRLGDTDYFYYAHNGQTHITDASGNLLASLDAVGELIAISDRYLSCLQGSWEDETQLYSVYSMGDFRLLWSAQQRNRENTVSYWSSNGTILRTSYSLEHQSVDILDPQTGKALMTGLNDFRLLAIGQQVYLGCADHIYTYNYGPDWQLLMKTRTEAND